MMEEIDNLLWETELEALIKVFEKKENWDEKKRKKKLKPQYKLSKSFIKPGPANKEVISWKMPLYKNLKKYFFKKILKRVYEPELFAITTKSRKLLTWHAFKGKEFHLINLELSKAEVKSYKRLFFSYNQWFLNRKLVFYYW